MVGFGTASSPLQKYEFTKSLQVHGQESDGSLIKIMMAERAIFQLSDLHGHNRANRDNERSEIA